MKTNPFSQIEDFLKDKIVDSNFVGGGCIADSKIIETKSGKRFFLKTRSGAPGMFQKEAHGLKELAKANAIRVPEVILADEGFLLLEYIEPGTKTNEFFVEFGKSFARMHKFTAAEFGFFEDNYIGATAQYNVAVAQEKMDWATFYFEKRLKPQIELAEQKGYASTALSEGIRKLKNKLPKILKGSEEAPTLLHGDLWGGNYMCDVAGKAVLIDPAVYYGHREADLAMTKMFGGFTADFYMAYNEAFPLKDGWQYRENIYLLYHYLNHLNLFGRGYYSNCIHLVNSYL